MLRVTWEYIGFRDISPIVESQTDKKTENEMEAEIMQWLMGLRVSQNYGWKLPFWGFHLCSILLRSHVHEIGQ